jgi:serine/threonine-protein kinase
VIRKKYRVDALIGAGGMGTVFRAYHLELGRPVALKVMHDELVADAESSRRFAAEARSAAALESAHSVRILDIDRVDGVAGGRDVPFIVMELLEGEDLGTLLLREGRINYVRAVEYILQALEAVAEAHARGIVHRDLKPQNLFLTRRGSVKVVDFGLAKSLSLSPLAPSAPAAGALGALGTQTKVMMGSPQYMSPEQVRSARRVDHRTDIWALGATLHNLVGGTPPFSAPNLLMLCARIINERTPSLLGRVPELPPMLDAIIQRCLRKDAAERYASCEELEVALRDALDATRVRGVERAGVEHCVEKPRVERPAPTDTAPMATLPIPRRRR